MLADSGADVLIAEAALLARLAADGPDRPQPTHRYSVRSDRTRARGPFADLLLGGPAARSASTGGEDLAVLLYTSGTAGAPRAAMLTHRALIANHRQVDRVDPPIVAAGRRAPARAAAVPRVRAQRRAGRDRLARRERRTGGPVRPGRDPARHRRGAGQRGHRRAADVRGAGPRARPAPTRSATVRLAISGAAPLGAAAAQRFRAASGQRRLRGVRADRDRAGRGDRAGQPGAEGRVDRPAGARASSSSWSTGRGAVVAGSPRTGWSAATPDDFDDDAGGVPGTDPGEIVVRGPNLFSGYWPDGADGPDADGWWATGDVAYADADGDLFLVDRLGELIIVNGFNVYPHEVELVLAAHPGVARRPWSGVPNAQTGEAVKAYVVPRVARAPQVELVDELRAHCERNLARFKCPATIEFVPALAHSATGKIRKGVLTGGIMSTAEVRLTLITRAECHLCDVAKEALARIAAETGEQWRRWTSTPTRSCRPSTGTGCR